MIARKSSSSSLGPFSMSQWLVSEETEVGDCKAFAPCVVDDSGIPTSRVSQNPLTPKGLAKQTESRECQRRNNSTTAGDSWLFRFDHIWSPGARRRFVDLDGETCNFHKKRVGGPVTLSPPRPVP